MAFGYALLASLLFQKLILPALPSLHGAHGLLKNDALFFHDTAVDLARQIHASGWAVLELFSFSGLSGNVKLLAAIYALFGVEPAWFLPITCALHALAAVLLYRLGALLWPGRTGQLGGLIAAALFTLSPTSLQWYGQNHKDAFAIAGTLLLVHAWVRGLVPDWGDRKAMLVNVLLASVGAVLVLFVRSYLLQILLGAMVAGTLLAWTAGLALKRRNPEEAMSIPRALLPVVVAAVFVAATPRHQLMELVLAVDDISTASRAHWEWEVTESLPASVDGALRKLSTTRAHFASSGQSAGSIVDGDRLPDDALEALAFLPRALAIGLFAPFPDTWVERPTVVRLIGAFETLVWYVISPGILLFAFRRPTVKLFACLGFAAVALAIMGYAEPVVGTLYRLRFGIWVLLLLAGAVGWAHAALRLLDRVDQSRRNAASAGEAHPRGSMTDLASDGGIVLLLWGFSLVGFLIRDLVLVGTQGLDAQLGAFFAAAMVPMFFFAFLSAPMADALTGPLLGADQATRRRMIRASLGWSALTFVLISAALHAWAEPVMAVVLSGADAPTLRESARMLRWSIPFLACSGWTVIGAAVLNAGRRSRVVAAAQLCVPIVAVTAFLVLGESVGVMAVVYGMLAGMAINTAMVCWAAARAGYPLLPSFEVGDLPVRDVLWRYVSLGVAALFAAGTVPLNFAFAGMLGADAVPAWAFASKLVQVFTTTVGFAIGAVVLPHLGTLVAARSRAQLRDDTVFLLVIGAWVSALCALAVDALAEPVAVALLAGDRISAAQASQLADILRIGALQLPFVVSGAVLAKVAAVAGGSWRATMAAAVGFAVNLGGNMMLAPILGVEGVAFASTAGAGMASVTMLLLARRRADLAFRDVALVCGLWAGVAILGAAVTTRSLAIALLSVAILAAVACMQWAGFAGRGEAAQ